MKRKRWVFVAAIACFFLLGSIMPSEARGNSSKSASPASEPINKGYYLPDFRLIAEKGFDSPQNNYAWSSASFQGDIYIGTARNFVYQVLEVLKQVGMLPPDYEYQFITHPEGSPWSMEFAEEMSGEIWRFRKGDWSRVYKSSPVDVSFLSIPGAPTPAYAAKEPGFRSMITFTDQGGEEAIYAASGASLVPGRLLIKSTDGTSWKGVVTPPASMESDSRSMAVHNGKLFIGPAGVSNTATIWATDDPKTTGDGSNWKKVADFTLDGPGRNVAVVAMVSYRGYLYAGTQNDEAGFQVWRSKARSPEDPQIGDWAKIIDYGAGDMGNTRALTMAVFQDSVIVGSSMFPIASNPPGLLAPKGFEVIRIHPDDSWELLVGDYLAQKPPGGIPSLRLPKSLWPGGFGNFLNLYCWSLISDQGVLYLGSFDTSSFLYVLLSDDSLSKSILPSNIADSLSKSILPSNIEGLRKAIGSLDRPGMEKFFGPYRELAGALDAGDLGDLDWEQIWDILKTYFFGADLWKTTDGIHWEPVTLNGFGNPENYGIRTMLSEPVALSGLQNSLYIGTANPFGGLEVWRALKENAIVPALDKWGLLVFALLTGSAALYAMKRRSRAKG